MTLNDLLIDCCTRLNYPPDLTLVETKVKDRFTAFLNQTLTDILGQPSYQRLLQVQSHLITEAGINLYGLPSFLERISAIVDRKNQRRLGVLSTDTYRRYLPNPDTQQGTPVSYAFDGWGAMFFQPLQTEDIHAISTNTAADNGTVVTAVCISPGTSASPQSELAQTFTATLDASFPFGVPLVPTGGPTGSFFVAALTCDKPIIGTAVDFVGFLGGSPTRFLSRLLRGSVRARYPQVYLAPTPSGRMTFDVFGEGRVIPMTLPSDEPVLPPRFHPILAAGARMKEYELRGDTTRYAIAKREYDSALSFLNSWMSTQPDAGDQMHPDDGRFGGTSVLGPWFPASSYRGF